MKGNGIHYSAERNKLKLNKKWTTSPSTGVQLNRMKFCTEWNAMPNENPIV
jgi:hypothetical protein